jgi:hypothetical protein
MLYPEIIILAVGGSHGDFLLQSCKIMTNEKNINTDIDHNGRTEWTSHFKNSMNMSYYKGKKNFIKTEPNNLNRIELSHVYYDEFNEWPTKFFYIDFSKEHLNIILDMFIKKVCNDDIDKFLFYIKNHISEELFRKINKENYKEIMRILWWNAVQKYKKLKNIERIDILSFYEFENICKILKKLKVYNEKYLKIYEKFYQKWYKNNENFIQNIIKT